MNSLDWDLVRAFLGVAEHGSVSAAARAARLSQPTLSRQVRALEQRVGCRLFDRSPQGLVLTEQGAALVDAARGMGEAADRFARLSAGLSEELDGEIRISANEVVGYHLLPPLLSAFRAQHPGVQVELVISNGISSLSKREADLALRMFRPSQPDVVAQRLPDLEVGLFAHRQYLERRGTPASLDELKGHELIGFDNDPVFLRAAAGLGAALGREDFALRTDHMPAQIALIRAGAGIGATHVGLGAAYPELVRVLPEAALPALEFWSVCHRDVQFNARIRALRRFILGWFAEQPYAAALL